MQIQMQERRGDFLVSFPSCVFFGLASLHHGQLFSVNIMYQSGTSNGYTFFSFIILTNDYDPSSYYSLFFPVSWVLTWQSSQQGLSTSVPTTHSGTGLSCAFSVSWFLKTLCVSHYYIGSEQPSATNYWVTIPFLKCPCNLHSPLS